MTLSRLSANEMISFNFHKSRLHCHVLFLLSHLPPVFSLDVLQKNRNLFADEWNSGISREAEISGHAVTKSKISEDKALRGFVGQDNTTRDGPNRDLKNKVTKERYRQWRCAANQKIEINISRQFYSLSPSARLPACRRAWRPSPAGSCFAPANIPNVKGKVNLQSSFIKMICI